MAQVGIVSEYSGVVMVGSVSGYSDGVLGGSESGYSGVVLVGSVSEYSGVVLVGSVSEYLEVLLVVLVQLPDLAVVHLSEEVPAHGARIRGGFRRLLALLHFFGFVFETLKKEWKNVQGSVVISVVDPHMWIRIYPTYGS